jgi:hypothetical protein
MSQSVRKSLPVLLYGQRAYCPQGKLSEQPPRRYSLHMASDQRLPRKFPSTKSLACHLRTHSGDSRGPYQCSKCSLYFADRYTLSFHCEDCKGLARKAKNKKSGPEVGVIKQVVRVPLSDSGPIPRIFIVARSSGGPPAAWKAGRDDFIQGLPLFGRQVLLEFRKAFNDRGAAVLHVASDVPSREVPAPLSSSHSAAINFTRAIEDDLRKSTNPVIITMGWDGFSCSTKLIGPWLARMPAFQWVLRLPNLTYCKGEEHLLKSGGAWWASHKSSAIRSALAKPDEALPDVDQTVVIWDHIQGLKDGRTKDQALVGGRNRLKANDLLSEIDTDDEDGVNDKQ